MDKEKIVVMKFGGSVLKDAEGFKRAAKIIKAEKRKKIVVVSAMAGVTDELYQLAGMAAVTSKYEFKENEPGETLIKYRSIWSKHLKVLQELDTHNRPDAMDHAAREIEKVLDMISYTKEASPMLTAAIVSKGETFSAIILSSHLNENSFFTYAPVRAFIITDDTFLNAQVIISATEAANYKTPDYLNNDNDRTLVMEGFVGATRDGRTTLLGRNGSDYTAAILGSILKDVEEVQFWKDVPGVMTVDPKLSRLAKPISSISYDEIIEATRLGAKILHPESIAPLFGENEKRIVIKNINAPSADGTEIVKKSINKTSHGVTMITVERNLIMYSVQEHIESKKHLAPKIYLALREVGIEFATNSQGFSDKNFTIVSRPGYYQKIEQILKEYCHVAPKEGKFERLPQMVAQIAVIGANMRGKPGIAGKFFTALGKAGVNILTIQQGSSECSMAATINNKDIKDALCAVHDEFDLQKP